MLKNRGAGLFVNRGAVSKNHQHSIRKIIPGHFTDVRKPCCTCNARFVRAGPGDNSAPGAIFAFVFLDSTVYVELIVAGMRRQFHMSIFSYRSVLPFVCLILPGIVSAENPQW